MNIENSKEQDVWDNLIDALSADGYSLSIERSGPDSVVAAVVAGPDACAQCLVPKDIMRVQFEEEWRAVIGTTPPAIKLVYPSD